MQSLKFLHEHNIMHRDLKPSNILLDYDLNVKICDFGLARLVPRPQKAGSSPRKPRRCLSQHVVSRYYRPPEVALIEPAYTEKVDLWSFGCILAEMLSCSQPYKKYVKASNRILFKGNSSYPLSPYPGDALGLESIVADDLMFKICNVMGKQTVKQTEFITSIELYKHFQSKRTLIDFKKEYFKTSSEFVGVLESLLQFNPSQRMSATALLKEDIFTQLSDADQALDI